MSLIAFTKFLAHWNFSAYKSDLLSLFHFLRSEEQDAMRTVKMNIRFGKELFGYGKLADGCFVSLLHLQELFNKNLLTRGFSTAFSERAVSDLRLHLERLQYIKVSVRKKINIHITYWEETPLR
ncbi:hypothetical protein KI387_028449, partial [Taxus chinensis]